MLNISQRLELACRTLELTFSKNEINMRQCYRALGCRLALAWIAQGLTFSEISSKAQDHRRNSGMDGIVYHTILRVIYKHFVVFTTDT